MIAETLAAVIGLVELVALDHRPHRAVEHENARRQQRMEARKRSVVSGHVEWPSLKSRRFSRRWQSVP
jgi:hypothetical protein